VDAPVLELEVAGGEGCAWRIEVFVNNSRAAAELIEGPRRVTVDLSPCRNQDLELRLFQRTLTAVRIPGNAYWKRLHLHRCLSRSPQQAARGPPCAEGGPVKYDAQKRYTCGKR
jgi:hypothetical protein